eukprot:m.1256024 g.1256024  ORF g.1256024 m.1256024 type:complete len:134 (+) comp24710_c1_seq46:1824-2225(+)
MLACYLEPTFDERVFKLFRHPCIDPTSGARYDSLFQWAVELMTMAIVGERQTIPSVQSIGRFLDFEGTAPPVVGMSAIDGFRVDLIHAGVLELCCSALSMEVWSHSVSSSTTTIGGTLRGSRCARSFHVCCTK